ncbi:flagellar motor protein MotB [Thiocystis minor]|uniref:flagellar motor protein MotB n=1 Tax=Thiocystis minor TaxID=61597 RepID=UPI001912C8C6|nr:flagellar motor protein MotB [Thiocystis minor]MBK5967142.1 flagellar motor protein MotB [Thiocystis minor]
MAIDTNKQPIIIKKVFKSGGHHGGAWKIAFADFATAMMAFFMLLWLMGSTTKEQKAAISEYFNNPSAFEGVSTSPSQAQGEGTGSTPSIIAFEGAVDMAPESSPSESMDPNRIEEMAAAQDQERLESLKELLEEALEQSEALIPYKEQLLIDIISEGLRIQIVDKENRSMFDSGSAQLKSYTDDILKELGTMINQVPNRISLTGHTDARPLARGDFSNWELSTERANTARRALVAGGMQEEKVGRVVGFADTVPFDQTDPNNPINRRISIIVMNKKTDEAIHQETTTIKDLVEPTSH